MLYPAEADDVDILPAGFKPSYKISFLKGWNFTTDMYRMLEHLVDRIRSRQIDPRGLGALFSSTFPSSRDVLDRLDVMYNSLPEIFKAVQPMTGDVEADRYGFQAANIIVTMQTVKLTLAVAEDYDAEQRCTLVTELVQALTAIPTSYIAAVSRPLVSSKSK